MAQGMKTIFMLLFLLIAGLARSQLLVQQIKIARGMIINDSTSRNIAFVHIYNESQRKGYITDEEGRFKIPASNGDTLVVSALGYNGRVVTVSDSCFHPGITIKLLPRIYEIEEVTIRALMDYEDFKRQFLALKLPETETTLLRENLAILSQKTAKEAHYEKEVEDMLQKPSTEFFTVSVPILSRDDKQRLNFIEVLKKEERQRVIEKKYNREIIYKVTQLEEDEITEFMGYCNFSEEFLYKANPYDILVKIEEKFKEFKKLKESGKLFIKKEEMPEELLG